ncbi:MAG: prephenate dehydratase [Solirubrobacterales bacterium]|nr:prephenate dehydratase [Solirubrobacterales bacterium]
MRVAYLGPEGTFSEEAALAGAPGAVLVPVATVADAVEAVGSGDADRAVVPIENALEGPVGPTLDSLAGRPEVAVVGEAVQPISVHLIAGRRLELGAVRCVLSHPQPLAQCSRFLREHLRAAELVPTRSTAEAVRRVVDDREGAAALGSRRAAALYGGVLLAQDVEDDPGNATRFVWLARAGTPSEGPGPCKTSLTFWGEGDASAGWLVRCLGEFAFRGVNLTKIESRPLRGRLGHYRFFVDCDGALGDDPVRKAVDALRDHCHEVRVLGSYPAAR